MISDDKLKQIVENFYITGADMRVTHDTMKRYIRLAKSKFPEWYKAISTYTNLHDKYTDKEIELLINGDRNIPAIAGSYDVSGNNIKFAFVTDTHFGAACYDDKVWNTFVKVVDEVKPDFIVHTGDVTDGFTTRHMDAVFDMTALGYGPQKEYSLERLKPIMEYPIYMIAGNHDLWYRTNMNANIVEDIVKEHNNNGGKAIFLGNNVGDLHIKTMYGDVLVRLWHGEDGSSYGTSYRVQKLIEAMPVNDKPNLLLCGHTHKMISLYEQGVYAVSGGAICKQSNWMKIKRLPNHTGFYIINMRIGEGREDGKARIVNLCPTWYGFES